MPTIEYRDTNRNKIVINPDKKLCLHGSEKNKRI